jgi:hypothetical protein
MKLKLIACEIFYRELCAAVSRSPNQVDLEFLPKGLHDIGSQAMVARLQEALDRVDGSRYEAVLLGYGLCNNGLVGLAARSAPLVIPRAHDCITLFLGSRERYMEYFHGHPGVYFMTTGWIERGADAGELRQVSISHQVGLDRTFEELVAKYGEDNARYLHEQLCDTTRNYSQFTYIEMGIEPGDLFERRVEDEAERRGWSYEKIRGDMGLIQRLVDGDWGEKDFLIVPPGDTVAASYGEGVIRSARKEPKGDAT